MGGNFLFCCLAFLVDEIQDVLPVPPSQLCGRQLFHGTNLLAQV
jgi:hypothetical protein